MRKENQKLVLNQETLWQLTSDLPANCSCSTQIPTMSDPGECTEGVCPTWM